MKNKSIDQPISMLKATMILSDLTIQELCSPKLEKPMIKPFFPSSVNRTEGGAKALSFGVSSYGYDVRLSREEVKIFHNHDCNYLDVKNFNPDTLLDPKIHSDETGEYFWLPPHSYALGYTPEWFIIPRDVTVICVGKSTYARVSVGVNCTPIEAGFEGNVVIEITNMCSLPNKIYVNEGIAQFLFFRGDQPCQVSYADRHGKGGKYQAQKGTQTAKV